MTAFSNLSPSQNPSKAELTAESTKSYSIYRGCFESRLVFQKKGFTLELIQLGLSFF